MAAIKNIKAYSENDGLDKLAAPGGDYDDTVPSITVFTPYEMLNGGLELNEPVTLAFDNEKKPEKVKGLKYRGVILGKTSLLFN